MARIRLADLDSNYLDTNRVFVACSDTGEYLERRDVVIASCGLPVEQLNWGFLKPPFEDLESTARFVRSYFADRRLPFQLLFRSNAPGDPLPELEAVGWRRSPDPTPGMALAMDKLAPRLPDRLTVEPVSTAEQVAAFREAAFMGFGYPVAAAHIFLNERFLGLPRVRLYSGLVDGVVVATSMTVATGTIAGIYWVAAIEGQRGHGYGSTLTSAAIGGGVELGCEIASLQASSVGRPLYERMGFDHVLDYERLLPPD